MASADIDSATTHFSGAAMQVDSDSPALTKGALQAMNEGQKITEHPILQVLAIKKSLTEAGTPRFRLVLSDGVTFSLVMVSSSLAPRIETEVVRYAILQLTSFSVNVAKGKKLIVASNFEVLFVATAKIGSPFQLSDVPSDEAGEGPAQSAPVSAPSNPPPSLSQPVHQPPPPSVISKPQESSQPQIKEQPSRSQEPRRVLGSSQPPQQSHVQQQYQQQKQQQAPPQQRQLQSSQPAPSGQSHIRPSGLQNRSPNAPNPNSFHGGNQSRPVAVSSLSSGFSNSNPRPRPQQSAQSADSSISIFPIASLNPYQNRWVIKARVTAKSAVRTWTNARGSGELFSIDLLDQTGEIRAVGFSDAVAKFYALLEVGKIYYISRCQIRSANRQYSPINNNYEMQLDQNSDIALCDRDAGDVPTLNFNFVSISQIESLPDKTAVDVIGIVVDGGEVAMAKTKNGDSSKRTILILDSSNTSIKLTLWGTHAEGFEVNGHPVYAFKGVRVSDFNGRSLSASGSSTMYQDPDVREAHELRAWYENVGQSAAPKTLSVAPQRTGPQTEKKTITQMKEEGLGKTAGQEDIFSIKGMAVLIPHDGTISYPACPSENCTKKVVCEAPGQYNCDNCSATFPNCTHRFTLSVTVADFTGQAWFRAFDSVGQKIIGRSADEMMDLKNTDENLFHEVFQDALFQQFTFKIRAKLETYQENSRSSYQIVQAWPVDFIIDSKSLLKNIALYSS